MNTTHTGTRFVTASVGAVIAAVAVPALLLLAAGTAHAIQDVSERGAVAIIDNLPTPRDCGNCRGFKPQPDPPRYPDPGIYVGIGNPNEAGVGNPNDAGVGNPNEAGGRQARHFSAAHACKDGSVAATTKNGARAGPAIPALPAPARLVAAHPSQAPQWVSTCPQSLTHKRIELLKQLDEVRAETVELVLLDNFPCGRPGSPCSAAALVGSAPIRSRRAGSRPPRPQRTHADDS